MKKFIFVLLMLFVGGLIGGCGGSSNSPINNTTASNIWTSSTGTATIKAASDDLEILTSRFGALSSDVIAKVGYEKPKDTTASIPRTVLYIDTEKKLLTGVIFITNSEDSVFKPIVYNNVSITQQGDDWITPDGTKIISTSSTSSTGGNSTITGSNSELSFSSSLTRKAHDTALKLEDILPGTWILDGTICGGSSGDLIMLPEKITMHFDSDLNADIFYSIMNNQTAMFQDAFSTKGTLTKLDSDVYKYTETDGTESLIFVENIDEIFMFRLNMLLPLKKTSFTPAKTWKTVSGGGYIKFNKEMNDPVLNLIDTVSFTLKSGTLTLADSDAGDNTAVSFVYMFDVHNALLEKAGFTEVGNTNTTPMTFTPSGNFLKHTEGSEVYNLVFISEKEAFLGMTTNDKNGEGKFVARFEAAE